MTSVHCRTRVGRPLRRGDAVGGGLGVTHAAEERQGVDHQNLFQVIAVLFGQVERGGPAQRMADDGGRGQLLAGGGQLRTMAAQSLVGAFANENAAVTGKS